MHRILFIAPSRIGDAVLSTGVLAELCRRYPDARVTVACGPVARQVFETHPQLEQLTVLRKRKFAGHWLGLWARVAWRRWTFAIDLRRSALPWLLLARHRAVAAKGERGTHRVETYAHTLRLEQPPRPTVWLRARDRERADKLLGGAKSVLAIAPTANWPAKVWPADRLAELVARLTAADGPLPNAAVFITGGPNEQEQAQPVIDAVSPDRRVAAVGLDLATTAAVFERCRLFIGNDSGLMHLAAAAGAPTVGLFGPTDATAYAPVGRATRVVRTPESAVELVCKDDFDHRTAGSQMTSLRVDTVETTVLDLLANTQRGAASDA